MLQGPAATALMGQEGSIVGKGVLKTTRVSTPLVFETTVGKQFIIEKRFGYRPAK